MSIHFTNHWSWHKPSGYTCRRMIVVDTDDIVIPRLSIIFCIIVIRIMHVYDKNDSIFR